MGIESIHGGTVPPARRSISCRLRGPAPYLHHSSARVSTRVSARLNLASKRIDKNKHEACRWRTVEGEGTTREDRFARPWPDKVGERILAPLHVFM